MGKYTEIITGAFVTKVSPFYTLNSALVFSLKDDRESGIQIK